MPLMYYYNKLSNQGCKYYLCKNDRNSPRQPAFFREGKRCADFFFRVERVLKRGSRLPV